MENIKLNENERLDFVNNDLSIIQRTDAQTFGTDSYLLSAFAKKISKGKAADLGCGCGIISLLCASYGKYRIIHSFEIMPELSELCARNVRLNHLEEKITVRCADIRDIGEKDTDETVDVVITNPPYLKKSEGFKNDSPLLSSARKEINGDISDFCRTASRLLRTGGLFYCVYRADRMADLLFSMKENKIEPKKIIIIYPYIDSSPSLFLVEGKKDAMSSVIIKRPFIIYKKGTADYTEDMTLVYDNFDFSHFE